MAQLPAFTQQIGRPLALVHLYVPFHAAAPVATMDTIVATGATPIVDWNCASVESISSGAEDGWITQYAHQLRAFGHPVLLRWFWEMNVRDAKSRNCLGTAGTTGFIAAWRHIWTIFQQTGATNVSFVWCPGEVAGVPSMAPYFPGATYVNWIGMDGYDRKGAGVAAASQLFGQWYSIFAPYGLPMMIGETGSPAATQAAFLQGVQQNLPSQFPQIKAFAYFDAPGPADDWALTGSGLTAFTALGADPYFAPRA
jgi:hypothetical protein